MGDLKTSHSLLKLLLHELLEFGIDTSRQEREQALFEMFQDQFIVDNMSIFNEWLHLEVIFCGSPQENGILSRETGYGESKCNNSL